MGINGKKKGNRGELEIANEFSKLFNDTFRRVPQSGAIVGGLNRTVNAGLRVDAQEILAGDIICPVWFPFCVESKNYGEKTGPNMYAILDGNDRVLDGWLSQASGDASFVNKYYLLIVKITRKASYCIVDKDRFTEVLRNKQREMPQKYIIYNTSIILDKSDFMNNFIHLYFENGEK